MKDVTNAKGLRNLTKIKGLRHLQTATTKRLRARPPQRGTAYLDMYLISTEKRRREQELAHLEDRRSRVREHLKGILDELTRLRQVAQAEEAGERSDYQDLNTMDIPPQPPAGPAQPSWRTMSLGY